MSLNKITNRQFKGFFMRLRNYCGIKFLEMNRKVKNNDEYLKREITKIDMGVYYNTSNVDDLIEHILDNIEDFYFYRTACRELDIVLTLSQVLK